MNRGIPAVLARGGSSRGIIVLADELHDVPPDQWESLFALWVGSPDPTGRQANGTGGGNPSTSKVVVLGSSGSDGRDLDYTFFQIDPLTGRSERRGTCGNLTAEVGLLAVSSGLVTATAPVTTVRLRDTNTGRDINVDVPLATVPTSTETARLNYLAATIMPPITSHFLDPAGATTGRLFPTGASHESVEIDGKQLGVTVIDAVNPVVLVDGRSIGADADRSPADFEADSALMSMLERVRQWGAVRCGFASSVAAVQEESWYLPYVGMVFPPQDYTATDGKSVAAGDVDVVVRMLSGTTMHRALPLSAGLATAAAAVLDREDSAGNGQRTRLVRLGHPSGILTVDVSNDSEYGVRRISVESSARIIMRGYLEVE